MGRRPRGDVHGGRAWGWDGVRMKTSAASGSLCSRAWPFVMWGKGHRFDYKPSTKRGALLTGPAPDRWQVGVLLQAVMMRAVGEVRLLAARELAPEAWPRLRLGPGRLALFGPGDVVAYVRQVGGRGGM